MFDDVFANVFDTIRQLDGVDLRLLRGIKSTAGINAARGQTTYNAADQNGTLLAIDRRDYLIAASDYQIDGEPVEPQPGDMLEETLRGKIVRFEVIEDRGRSWRFSDPAHTEYRIHTQCVAEFDPDTFLSLGGEVLALRLGGALEPLELRL